MNSVFYTFITLFSFIQANYDTVQSSKINFDNISIDDSQSIVRKIDKKFKLKIYSPPKGDSEEYDKVFYYTEHSSSITFYDLKGKKNLSSIEIQDQHELKINNSSFKVGLKSNTLEVFKNSYQDYLDRLRNSAVNESTKLYLILDNVKNNSKGLITFTIKDGAIVKINITMNPA